AAGRWIRRPALLLAACHPAPAAAVTAFAAGLAAAAGRSRGVVLLTAAATAAGQLSIGWSNDCIDSARDTAAGRADKPLARGALTPGALTPRAVGTAAAAALAAAVPLSLACGTRAGAAHLTGVAAGWAYNLRLKRTAASWLPYAVAFGALPAFATADVPPWWVTGAAALLGCGAHFANVLPDIPADRAAGVLGLPQRLGRRPSAAVAAAATSAATAVLVLGPGRPVPPAEGVALAVAVATALLAPIAPGRIPFLATIAVAGLDVALLLARGPAAG
ncbi:UbiA family prenyltransferase, partial [Kitasatospora sp. NPDC007106]|uniref:UbiA family prenyltransferase n=1 Tax=Kitasatospora sp. NPDC007106 TaxID=3156914 RepID=UPI0033F8FA81